jgi:copper chaperone CopZ
VQDALQKVNGVVTAEVSHESGEARITYDAGKTSSKSLVKAVTEVQGMTEFGATVKSES